MDPTLIDKPTMDPSGFVVLADQVPGIIQEIRYHSTYNFVGERITGYEEPVALLTLEAARALKDAAGAFAAVGLRVKVFDAYRPTSAVSHFIRWGADALDLRMKPFFYPALDKNDLFDRGFIARQSSHSRGSAVDVTLLDMVTGRELDMGGPFDLFDEVSNADYRGITDEQYANRMLLQRTMVNHGFEPLSCEWWHFKLADEPYPDIYFEFPVSSAYLRR